MCHVRWRDSSLQNKEVDDADLPTPVTIESIGFVTAETDDYIILTRDIHADGGRRGSVCILKLTVLSIRTLVIESDARLPE